MSSIPIGWNQWKITAYTGKNRNVILGHTFVKADTEQQACKIGRVALKTIGIRGSCRVSARPYLPWQDIAFLGFLTANQP